VRATWPHRQRGRGAAPRADASVAPLATILAGARDLVAARVDAAPTGWVLGGRSYGGRVASMLVAERGGPALGVEHLLCIAYPLVPPARRDGVRPPARTAHWHRIDVPVHLVVGTRDHFWDEAAFEAGRAALTVPVELTRLADGDHELRVRARDAPDGRALDAAAGARATGAAIVERLARG
jgi:predicted alpha/beta-hydrolase family hydrolase